MRLLVIEDHPDILANITDYLTAAGHVVDCAHNGPGGLHLALTGSYDLIVLDIMLPGMDGYQLCRSLRASGKRTPIIMLTARDTLDDRLHGLREGAEDFEYLLLASANGLPQTPDIFVGFRDRFCSFAILIDTAANSVRYVLQHNGRPQIPIPPRIFVSSLTPI